MNRIKVIFLLFCFFANMPLLFSNDTNDDLHIALLTQEMIFDIWGDGNFVMEKYATANHIACLERVAKGSSKMADIAQRILRVRDAYKQGVREDKLEALLAAEITDYGYDKIKSITMNYIKDKITTIGQLTEAFEWYKIAYDTGFYTVYIGMSIGLKMLDEETIQKLENSGFHKAATIIDGLREKIMSDAADGAKEVVDHILTTTENTMFAKFSEWTTDKIERVMSDAADGAKDLVDHILTTTENTMFAKFSEWTTDKMERIMSDAADGAKDIRNWFTSNKSSSSEDIISRDDNVADNGEKFNDDNSIDGDNITDNGTFSDGEAVENGDSVYQSSYAYQVLLNGGVNDQTVENGDLVYQPSDNNYITDEGNNGNPGDAGNIVAGWSGIGKVVDAAAILPTIPHKRVLWLFSGESMWDSFKSTGKSLAENIDLSELRKNFSDMWKKVAGKGDSNMSDIKSGIDSVKPYLEEK